MSEPIAGEFCWNELLTSDTAGAKKFYGEVFGWEANDMDMGGMTYTVFRVPGALQGPAAMTAGMMQSPMPENPPAWLSYILVEDVAATLNKASAAGATVIRGVTELPMGTFAVFADPQGAVFAIWKKNPNAG